MGLSEQGLMVLFLCLSFVSIICCIFAVEHNSDLNRTLIFVLKEHEKLLDRMYEGALILAKPPETNSSDAECLNNAKAGSRILFMNEHAQNILQKFMSFDFLKSAKKSFLDRLALSQKSFEPIDLTDNTTLMTRETRPQACRLQQLIHSARKELSTK